MSGQGLIVAVDPDFDRGIREPYALADEEGATRIAGLETFEGIQGGEHAFAFELEELAPAAAAPQLQARIASEVVESSGQGAVAGVGELCFEPEGLERTHPAHQGSVEGDGIHVDRAQGSCGSGACERISRPLGRSTEVEMPTYAGSCHCGAVRLEVQGEMRDLVACNCSICTRTAYIHWEVPPAAFRLLTPENALASYQFGTQTSQNYFCKRCGISPFRRSRTAPDKVDVNVRCLEGVDLEALSVGHFDGRNWEEAARTRRERR